MLQSSDSLNYLTFALIEWPKLKKLEEVLLIVGGSLFVLGVVLLVSTVTYEYVNAQIIRKRELILRDAMIIPPRCEKKCEEIGMNGGKNWRDYFVRPEPFYQL
ncbi:hypothetical protein M3Y94_01216600 [Aphelenchoides besseyi]|nr:hypothetical protein M3Y94_01216600 [Aphelenchoides besseyi]KAI6219762.1 hypothetical protein M3Y95_01100900 [Aphelenchoides besseyi]